MTKLLECAGCTRHVRVDDGRCPFCGRPSTISAPARVLALVLPLTLMACSGGEAPAAGKPADAKPAEVKPAEVKPTPVVVEPPIVEPAPVDDGGTPPQPSVPADDGAEIDEPTVPDDERIMTTKYGAPPAMDDGPGPVLMPEPETRPARKYGAPPRIDPRPAKKYGAPPKPDPLG